MNEDVFAAPSSAAVVKTVDSDIQEVTEQIHRLLLQVSRWDRCRGAEEQTRSHLQESKLFSVSCGQPVHTSGSSGYSSLPRTDHILSTTSSSEDNCCGGKMPEQEEETGSKSRPVSRWRGSGVTSY